MSEFVHISVLADEVLHYLDPRPGGVYCDGTLGGAGHAKQILYRSAPDGRLVAIDRDEFALTSARAALDETTLSRMTLVHNSFGNLADVLRQHNIPKLDGVVLDLGPSSPHFDIAERGFSFSKEGPLDMRMDQSRGETAQDLIRRLSVPAIAEILREFGEERYHKRIAERIKDAQRAGQLNTTSDLADLVTRAVPTSSKRKTKIHPATKTFQALRIAVNGELDQLQRFLDVFPDLLAPGGRCVVISFHSLEDRLVKHRFRELAWSSSLPASLARQAGERVSPICNLLTRKAVFATDEEVAANPRSRSARLRACERTAACD